jgi:NhaP-type Na+/H+ or K+/H+ antiporter
VLSDPIGSSSRSWRSSGPWRGGDTPSAYLARRLVTGLFIGLAGGELIYRLLRWIPDEMINVFSIAGAVGIFGIAEAVIAESGLLSVTVAGLLVGAHQPPSLRAIKDFKAVITDLLIGLLFILLVARLDIGRFFDFGLHGLLFLGVFLLVVRPLVILASTAGQGFKRWRADIPGLGWRRRGGWRPRWSSAFTLALVPTNPNAHFRETFTYS